MTTIADPTLGSDADGCCAPDFDLRSASAISDLIETSPWGRWVHWLAHNP